jgi:hypothetical protein
LVAAPIALAGIVLLDSNRSNQLRLLTTAIVLGAIWYSVWLHLLDVGNSMVESIGTANTMLKGH